MTAARDAVKRIIADVYAGKLQPSTAAGLAPLLHLQLRAIEKTDFEQRLVKAEKQLARLKGELEKAQREKDQERQSEEAFGKRPPQAVKPDGLTDRKISDES